MNAQNTIDLDHDLAVSLVENVIYTLDQGPLRPHIDAMMTDGYKEAVAISAISGDAPDDLDLFLIMCKEHEILTGDETFDLSCKFVDAERASAAA